MRKVSGCGERARERERGGGGEGLINYYTSESARREI